MCSKSEFADLIKSFFSENVTSELLVKEWYGKLKIFKASIIAKALTTNGNYRMNNLKEIEECCSDLAREERWNREIEKNKDEQLSEEDKEYARSYYKKYCDSEEEYHKKLKENGLEE